MGSRGNFNEVSKGGLGFVEGYVLIQRSVAKVFQFPMNSQTKEQSEAFIAMVWEGIRLTPEWKPLDAEDNTFEIINRMGGLDTIRPGKLDPKDFDNTDVVPDDLGQEVGTEGNSFYFEDGAKFAVGWGIMKESLEKHGFSSAILGRCVASDFEGTMAHFKTEEGKPYIASKGKNAGKEVKPTNLVCDRIHVRGYEVAAKDKQAFAGKKAASKGAGASTADAGASTSKANGSAAADAGDIATEVGTLFADFSDKFKAEIPVKTSVKRDKFQKALTMELLRKRVAPDVQKRVMDFVKSDQLGPLGDALDLFKVEGDTITLA